jgi:hypothetical protein
MGIGNQPHHPIDPKSGHAAMASRLNWGNSLERAKEGLDDCALSEQELLNPRHDAVFHRLADRGDHVQALVEQGFKELLGDITPVAEGFSRLKPWVSLGTGVQSVAGGEVESQPLPRLIDDPVVLLKP